MASGCCRLPSSIIRLIHLIYLVAKYRSDYWDSSSLSFTVGKFSFSTFCCVRIRDVVILLTCHIMLSNAMQLLLNSSIHITVLISKVLSVLSCLVIGHLKPSCLVICPLVPFAWEYTLTHTLRFGIKNCVVALSWVPLRLREIKIIILPA